MPRSSEREWCSWGTSADRDGQLVDLFRSSTKFIGEVNGPDVGGANKREIASKVLVALWRGIPGGDSGDVPQRDQRPVRIDRHARTVVLHDRARPVDDALVSLDFGHDLALHIQRRQRDFEFVQNRRTEVVDVRANNSVAQKIIESLVS